MVELGKHNSERQFAPRRPGFWQPFHRGPERWSNSGGRDHAHQLRHFATVPESDTRPRDADPGVELQFQPYWREARLIPVLLKGTSDDDFHRSKRAQIRLRRRSNAPASRDAPLASRLGSSASRTTSLPPSPLQKRPCPLVRRLGL